MPIYITNVEAEELARELAAQAGESITSVVLASLRERRDRLRGMTKEERYARLREISDHAAAIIDGRIVDTDELYDEYGAPK